MNSNALKALENLASIGQLNKADCSDESFARMLVAARTRLQDANRVENSLETRFDCAYTAIRIVADAVLLKHGYRAPTNRPGNHQTAIQSLAHTMSVDPVTLRVLDGLRKQRNVSDYEGGLVSDKILEECISQASTLLEKAGSS